MLNVVLSFIGGALVTGAASYCLFAAPQTMPTSRDAFHPRVYYVVTDKRFDWFRKDGPNALGGYTLDGRRISAVYRSGPEPLDAVN